MGIEYSLVLIYNKNGKVFLILWRGDIVLASERYYELTTKKYVYNIMPIANIPSVLQHGIVCFDQMQKFQHSSIAMNDVQERRSRVEIPNGCSLHQYANLYFSFHNPMLYKRQGLAD